jgi:hypothetical protein
MRIEDKIQRSLSITKNGVNLINDERIQDTLLDLHNYAAMALHRPKRKMRQIFYKKIKKLSNFLFGDVKAPLKGVILFDDYNLL